MTLYFSAPWIKPDRFQGEMPAIPSKKQGENKMTLTMSV
jgi:hypothetical protein